MEGERGGLPPVLELEALCFAYPDGRKVLAKVDFRLDAGEKAGLMGYNGSGKTTFLRCVMGLLKPASGVVRVFGRRMETAEDWRDARRRMGFLFQDSDDQLFSPTVLEDVAFGPLNLGQSPAQARAVSLRVLKELGLEGYEDRITYKLSGGEKRLVALATILAMEPRVLLLDEPTNGLHPSVTDHLVSILNGLDVAFLAVSHHMEFLRRVACRFYEMKDGRLAVLNS